MKCCLQQKGKRPLHMEVKVGSETDYNIYKKRAKKRAPDKYNSSTRSSDVENDEQLWKTIFRIIRQNVQFTWNCKL
jgi:hypothetical protein